MKRFASIVPALLIGVVALLPLRAADPPAAPAAAEKAAPVAIISAMQSEIALLQGQLTGRGEQRVLGVRYLTGKLGGREVILCVSGVGKVNAAVAATLLIDHFQPSCVLFTGIAGGLNPDLGPGDIVIAAKTTQHDLGMVTPGGFEPLLVKNVVSGKRNPPFFVADAALLAVARAAGERVKLQSIPTTQGEHSPKVCTGIVVTGDQFIASEAKQAELRKRLNADAVEMEGAAVAQVCHQFNVPALIIRSLSDKADSRASADMARFEKIAAANAATLTREIVAGLPANLKAATQPAE